MSYVDCHMSYFYSFIYLIKKGKKSLFQAKTVLSNAGANSVANSVDPDKCN